MRAIDLLVGPPYLDRLLPARPAGGRRACAAGLRPMVTTSPQPVHASLPERSRPCTRRGLLRRSSELRRRR